MVGMTNPTDSQILSPDGSSNIQLRCNIFCQSRDYFKIFKLFHMHKKLCCCFVSPLLGLVTYAGKTNPAEYTPQLIQPFVLPYGHLLVQITLICERF